MKNKSKILIKIQSFLIIINTILMFGQLPVYAVSTSEAFMTKFNNLMNEYEPVVNIGLSVLLLNAMLIFIYHIVQLTQSADNPQKRSEAIHNLLICGVCLAVQGSISIFIMLYCYLFV